MLAKEKQVIGYSLGLVAFIACCLFLLFFYWSYPEWQQFFGTLNTENTWIDYQNVGAPAYGFSETTFRLVEWGSLGIAVLSFVFWYKWLPGKIRPFKTVFFFVKKGCNTWQSFPRSEKIIVVLTWLVLLIVRLYFLKLFRVGMDEVSSYILFLHNGLKGIVSYYPFPNNHIFYTLLCWPLKVLFADPFWILRLPTLLISIFGSAILYVVLRSCFRFPVVYPVVSGVSFSYLGLYYAVNGRGYFLLLLFAAFAAVAILKICEKKEPVYWLVFLISSVCGFYTVPVFLYPFVALLIFGGIAFWKNKNWSALRNLIVVTFFTGISTILLYSPVLLVSGAARLLGNVYVTRISGPVFWQKLPAYLPYMQGSVLGQETIGFYSWLLGLIIIAALLLFRHKLHRFWNATALTPKVLLLVWCAAVIPWFLMLIQGVLPPERVWFFKAFPDFLALAIALQVFFFVFRFRFKQIMLATVFGVLIYAGYETLKLHRSVKNDTILDGPFDKIITAIRQRGFHTIISSEGYYTTFLHYDYYWHHAPLLINRSLPANRKNYDVVIVDMESKDFPPVDYKQYYLFHQDKYVRVYFHK